MKFKFSSVAAACLGTALLSEADDDVTYITLGQDVDYPPFAFQKDGELTGVGREGHCPNLEIKVP
jgi:ABC-type amino acid transport substrate-binding protein